MKRQFFICLLALFSFDCFAQTTLLIFSYNRPMQLYALLESVEAYIPQLSNIVVLYRFDNDDYQAGYDVVQQRFINVQFEEERRGGFRSQVIALLEQITTLHMLFAVDDLIVTHPVDVYKCEQLLKDCNAHGFYLRLGENTDYCYTMKCHQGVPPLQEVADNVYAWAFKSGRVDWNYPHTVDLTFFRTQDVMNSIQQIPFSSPNTLEAHWMMKAPKRSTGLCFGTSACINIPANRVQTNYVNRVMEGNDPAMLNKLFLDGYKIDITLFDRFVSNAAHQECEFVFIER